MCGSVLVLQLQDTINTPCAYTQGVFLGLLTLRCVACVLFSYLSGVTCQNEGLRCGRIQDQSCGGSTLSGVVFRTRRYKMTPLIPRGRDVICMPEETIFISLF